MFTVYSDDSLLKKFNFRTTHYISLHEDDMLQHLQSKNQASEYLLQLSEYREIVVE